MRKYYKIVAVCLIAMLSLGMLSACSGANYSNTDQKFTGQMHDIFKSVQDTKVENVVNTINDIKEVTGTSGEQNEPGDDNGGTVDENADVNDDNQNEGDGDGDSTDVPSDDGGDSEDGESYTTSCMTFNVLEKNTGGTAYQPPHIRAPWIVQTITKYNPDLLGCQEVTKGTGTTENYDMYTYLTTNLKAKGYAVNGLMDSKGKPGSTVALDEYDIGSGLLIFWKKDRFELKDSGGIVYTADKVQKRHIQWVKLYDKKEDITILMTNTHMSIDPKVGAVADKPAGDLVRAQEALQLFNFWEKNCKEDMALYATGDYNHAVTDQAFANMTAKRYVSTRDIAQVVNAKSGIDHILINGDLQDCYQYHRCNETFEPNGVTAGDVDNRNINYVPSDHYAVIAYCSNAYR